MGDPSRRPRCNTNYHGNYFDFACTGAHKQDYLRVAQTHFLPLVRPKYYHPDNCGGILDPPKDNVLTIHARWGDQIVNSPHPQAATLPCLIYDQIIAKFGFTSIRVVSESFSQPCIEGLQNRSRAGEFSLYVNTTLEAAVCEIMTARNIVLPDSTFSKGLVLMNKNLRFAFVKSSNYGGGPNNRHFEHATPRDPLGRMTQCLTSGSAELAELYGYGGEKKVVKKENLPDRLQNFPLYWMYKYPQMNSVFRGSRKREWMRDPSINITLAKVCSAVGRDL